MIFHMEEREVGVLEQGQKDLARSLEELKRDRKEDLKTTQESILQLRVQLQALHEDFRGSRERSHALAGQVQGLLLEVALLKKASETLPAIQAAIEVLKQQAVARQSERKTIQILWTAFTGLVGVGSSVITYYLTRKPGP